VTVGVVVVVVVVVSVVVGVVGVGNVVDDGSFGSALPSLLPDLGGVVAPLLGAIFMPLPPLLVRGGGLGATFVVGW